MDNIRTKLQNKLMVYFFILILLMSAVSLWIYVSSQRSIQQYDEILQRFLVLNEISQTTRSLNEALDKYTLHPSTEHWDAYEANKALLMNQREQLLSVMDNPDNRWLLKNYYHMIAYMTINMDETFDYFAEGKIEHYNFQRHEVDQMSWWVTERTLDLIHTELTSYHEFFSDVLARNRFYHTLGAGTSALFFISSIVFTYLFSNGITRPLRRLALQSKQISEGNFDGAPVLVTTRDEVGLLTETFNRMKSDIRELITGMKEKAVLERKLQEQTIKSLKMDHLLKEMELKALQNQINPHFLFNTLNTLSKMAYIEGAERTSELTVTVSNLLRYNLQQLDQAVKLEDELNYVRDYVRIQKERFGERITFELDVDERCLQYKVPCMTLQPFVENAFKHGVDSLPDEAVIRLNVSMERHNVVIEISDNGVGMDVETKQTIQLGKGFSDGHTTGIGTCNVLKRLRLYYEYEHVMEVESEEGNGTTIRLLLPRKKATVGRKEDHDV